MKKEKVVVELSRSELPAATREHEVVGQAVGFLFYQASRLSQRDGVRIQASGWL